MTIAPKLTIEEAIALHSILDTLTLLPKLTPQHQQQLLEAAARDEALHRVFAKVQVLLDEEKTRQELKAGMVEVDRQ